MDETKQPGLQFAQIFLASVHFEHRKDALSLPPNTSVGELQIQVNIRAGGTDDEKMGIVAVSVATTGEDPLYRFSLEMVALVEQEAAAKNLSVQEFVTKFGPATLYPFIRETVANVTGRGRFGPIWLKPFNVTTTQWESATPPSIPTPSEGNALGPQ